MVLYRGLQRRQWMAPQRKIRTARTTHKRPGKPLSTHTPMTSLLARRAQILTGIILAFSVYICIIQHVYLKLYVQPSISPSSFPTRNASSSPLSSLSRAHTKSLTTTNNAQPLPTTRTSKTNETTTSLSAKKYSCAIYWLRLPKTASTAIMHAFTGPLFNAQLFTDIQIGPNTCIQNVGGCAPFWEQSKSNLKFVKMEESLPADNNNSSDHSDNRKIHRAVPPYGLASTNETQQQHILHSNGHQKRCFPKQDNPSKLRCNEYDTRTSILNVGPHPPPAKKKKDKQKQQQHIEALSSTKSSIEQYYPFGPALKTHVGLDPSLFGWVFPHRTMIFSSFRNPIDRLLSSFHYGFTFGGGRPGEVRKCELLPGTDTKSTSKELVAWQRYVVKAREIATLKNDTRVYQQLLRGYLQSCRHAVDNAYVQFLDPNSYDVNVALYNLERYVIVGVQENMNRTLDRWRDVVLGSSCADNHPKFWEMKEVLAQRKVSFEKESVFRESVREVQGAGGKEVVGSNDGNNTETTVELISPDVEQFDRDLQQLVRELTAGDEVIYKRVVEMFYGSQNHLDNGLSQ